jgi:hypothetical protein
MTSKRMFSATFFALLLKGAGRQTRWLQVFGGAEVVCVAGVRRPEAVLIRRLRTGRLIRRERLGASRVCRSVAVRRLLAAWRARVRCRCESRSRRG